jgi:hypothetical protein
MVLLSKLEIGEENARRRRISNTNQFSDYPFHELEDHSFPIFNPRRNHLMKPAIFPKFRQNGIVSQDTENELLIYDLETNQAFCLNETSALVFGMCDGTKSISEMSRSLSTKLDSNISEDFVWLALDQLKNNNLLEPDQELVPGFGGLDRRQVIKQVALGTMVALPFISSVIAPTALQAQSGLVAGGCNVNSVCNGAGVISGVTVCDCPTITCPAGTTIGAVATAGVCVTATAAASVFGVNLAANNNGFVCVEAAACVTL